MVDGIYFGGLVPGYRSSEVTLEESREAADLCLVAEVFFECGRRIWMWIWMLRKIAYEGQRGCGPLFGSRSILEDVCGGWAKGYAGEKWIATEDGGERNDLMTSEHLGSG